MGPSVNSFVKLTCIKKNELKNADKAPEYSFRRNSIIFPEWEKFRKSFLDVNHFVFICLIVYHNAFDKIRHKGEDICCSRH